MASLRGAEAAAGLLCLLLRGTVVLHVRVRTLPSPCRRASLDLFASFQPCCSRALGTINALKGCGMINTPGALQEQRAWSLGI